MSEAEIIEHLNEVFPEWRQLYRDAEEACADMGIDTQSDDEWPDDFLELEF